MTDTPNTGTAEVVELDGWLIAELVRQHRELDFLRQDLAQLLGVEMPRSEPPRIPELIVSATAAEAVRSALPAILQAIRGASTTSIEVSAEVAAKVATQVAHRAPAGTTTTAAVRRVERDEHGRISRIIDEVTS